MKICILVEYLTYVGGGERVYTSWANMLASKGYAVEILSFEDAENTFYALNPSIKVKSLKLRKYQFYKKTLRRKVDMIFSYNNDIACLNKYFQNNKFDLIIGVATNICLLLSRLSISTSILCTEHTEANAAPLLVRCFRRLFYKQIDYLTVLTQSDFEYYTRFVKNVYILPNPLSFTVDTKAELNSSKIITIGSLSKQKNHLKMIDIFDQFLNIEPHWILEIYGEGPMRVRLEEKISKLGRQDSIFLKGSTSNVSEELLESSIFILTSIVEGFGLVLIEAMECGVPCISFDNPGPSEIIQDSYNGYLIKKNDQKDFIAKLHNLSVDIDLRKQLGANAADSVDKYRASRVSKCLFTIIENIIQHAK